MLFRPSFCANCGEKIERAEWHFWTSRRFCDICVTDMPVQEFAPKIIVGFAALSAVVLLFGSYLKPGQDKTELPVVRQKAVENINAVAKTTAQTPNVVVAPVTNVAEVDPATSQIAPRTLAALPHVKPEQNIKPAGEEPMYFCGAQTKKGTPCSRRVKGNVRCFQHQGMPAMVPADKLKVG